VYPARLASSAKVRVCVDFLADEFGRLAEPAARQ
jgi:LysR family transcriptional activator of dmlA